MRKLLLIMLWAAMAILPARAVETVLVGNVHDAGSGEPLQNAHVYFRGSKIGTTTNEEGFFFLRVDVNAKVRLVISMVGYKRQTYEILPGQSAGIEVYLEERTNELEAVVAIPGSNPALPLMAGVRAHRRENAQKAKPRETLPTNTHYFISDIQARHLKRRLWSSLQGGMIQQADSSYLLPLPADVYTQYAVPLPAHFDFYDSNIPLHTASFLSPLAASGNTFYNYWLMDSTVVSYGGVREKHYRVRFVPKNSFNPTLAGILEIDSATYALREVRASVAREVNVNFLTDLRYAASYGCDGVLQQENLSTLMEMAVKTDTSHLFPSLLACQNYGYDRGGTSPTYAQEGIVQPDTLVALDSAMSAYLHTKIQPMPVLAVDDSVVQAMQDSLADLPLFRVARWTAKAFYTGYLGTGTAVDIGRVTDAFGINPVERVHLGLPLRTNEKMSQWVSVGAMVGYGIRDRGVKYRFEVTGLLPTARRHLLGISVHDRYKRQEVTAFGALKIEDAIEADNTSFTARILGAIPRRSTDVQSTLGRSREVRVYTENDWCGSMGAKPGVETQLSVQLGHQGYGDPMLYHYYDMPSYQYASVRGIVRLHWGDRAADFFMKRRHVYSQHPTVYVGAEMGSYKMEQEQAPMGGDYAMYGLLNVLVRQQLRLGMGGQLHYMAEAGVVLGAVPYPLLSIMNGNGSYTFAEERFTLMNPYEFAADRYVFAHLHWDGKGILFNQIPGVRYAHLHELVEMKLAYGGLSSKHRQVLDYTQLFGENALQPLTMPYAEIGVGIGNIFRVGDVYSIWRLTHRSDTAAALWGIRFRFRLGL